MPAPAFRGHFATDTPAAVVIYDGEAPKVPLDDCPPAPLGAGLDGGSGPGAVHALPEHESKVDTGVAEAAALLECLGRTSACGCRPRLQKTRPVSKESLNA